MTGKVPTETTVRADIRHVCGHVQDLNAEQIKDYEKAPTKFGLDDRAPDADGKPTQVLHCLGCNRLAPLNEFTFVATGDNLDPKVKK